MRVEPLALPLPAPEESAGRTGPFPESRRVIYEKNPLSYVICQFRYPSILRIETELPSAYQERVREQYPLFKETQNAGLKIDLPAELIKLIGGSGQVGLRSGQPAYEFATADEEWKVNLTRDSLSVSTTNYRSWDDFKSHLSVPLKTLTEMYAPAFYTRIGLRYQDVIVRSNLDLNETPWTELLQPHIIGELGSPEIGKRIVRTMSETIVDLGDNRGQVVLRHGLVLYGEEVAYLIDSDFSFDQKTEINNALETLGFFNKQSGRLFRWCITERLHQSMEPQSA